MKTITTILALTILGIAVLGSGTDHGSKREFSQQLKAMQKLGEEVVEPMQSRTVTYKWAASVDSPLSSAVFKAQEKTPCLKPSN